MRQKKRIIKILTKYLGSLFFCIVMCSCTPNVIGSYQGYWMQKIEIRKNHTYIATDWIKYGLNLNTYNNTGTWKKKGHYLVLNSNNQPDNYNLISIEEKKIDTIPKGILYLYIKDDVGFLITNEGIPSLNVKATIDDKIYYPSGNLIKVSKPEITTFIIHGNDTDYPRYYVKNNNSNYFFIDIKTPKNENQIYEEFSYFTDEKLFINKDTLIYHNSMNLIKNKFH